jgi:hypothetical protein
MHSILLAILLGAAAGCQAPATAPAQVAVPAASPAPQQPARDVAPKTAPQQPDRESKAQVSPPTTDAAREPAKETAKDALREPAKPKQTECKFLCPESVDLTALVEAPPKPASAEHAKDEAILLWLQDRRTREDESRAWRSLSFDLAWFDEAIDARLDQTWYPILFRTFNEVRNDVSLLMLDLPESFRRERPHANPAIQPSLPREDAITVGGKVTLANGYPCGPALRATVFAALLANLFDDRKDALMERAREVGYARTLGGVNYPSDVRAAEQLGSALARQIIASDAWAKRKVDLQDELAAIAQLRERKPRPVEPEPAPAKPQPTNGSPQ